MTLDTARAAATVVLTRKSDAAVEVLMLRRSPDSPAFPGMWVFPGGAVNDADRADGDPLVAAAVRECAEECGIALPQSHLVQLSEWMPPPSARHRFQTAFFVAISDGQDVKIDDFEVVESCWIAPKEALARHSRGEWDFLPPTWVTLTVLADVARVAELIAPVAGVQRFHSEVVATEPTIMVWEGDDAHSESPGAPGARHRITLGTRPWVYEHTTGGQ